LSQYCSTKGEDIPTLLTQRLGMCHFHFHFTQYIWWLQQFNTFKHQVYSVETTYRWQWRTNWKLFKLRRVPNKMSTILTGNFLRLRISKSKTQYPKNNFKTLSLCSLVIKFRFHYRYFI